MNLKIRIAFLKAGINHTAGIDIGEDFFSQLEEQVLLRMENESTLSPTKPLLLKATLIPTSSKPQRSLSSKRPSLHAPLSKSDLKNNNNHTLNMEEEHSMLSLNVSEQLKSVFLG